MLKMKTADQHMNFYGDTNRGEFSWFILFMGCLGLIAVLFLILPNEIGYIIHGEIIQNIHYVILDLFICALTLYIFYLGYTLNIEYKNDGEVAIKKFGKGLKKGKLPPILKVEKLEKDNAMEFHFSRGIFHIDILVFIPLDVLNTILKYFKKMQPVDKINHTDNCINISYQDGTSVQLDREKSEAFEFLIILMDTQRERLQRFNILK